MSCCLSGEGMCQGCGVFRSLGIGSGGRERGGKDCLTVCEVQWGRAGYHHSHWSTLEFTASSKASWHEQRRNAFPKTWFGPVHAFSRQEKRLFNSIKRPSFESWIGAGISLDTGIDLATQCALQRVLADIPAGCFHILPLEVCEATHKIAGLGRQIYKGHCKALNTDLAYWDWTLRASIS